MSSNTATPKLFQPVKVGKLTLAHRIVHAPLTRFRNTESTYVPLANVKEYYEQRASTPGTLLISEGVVIYPEAGGCPYTPGIWSKEQIKAWKEVTDRVHAKGSFIYAQLWALGRAGSEATLKAADPSFDLVAPSAIPISGRNETPRPLTVPEIGQYVEWYAKAARAAVEEAGFDGVEVHCANGYLLDQFLQDVSNTRTDEYGGSVERRARFPLEVTSAVVNAVGADKVGVRLSPWNKFQDMRMKDPIPQFSYFTAQLKARHPDLAYLHVVEPRISGIDDRTNEDIGAEEQNDFLREIWAPGVVISAGGYTRETALKTADEKGDLIGMGRWFISNPDLPVRWQKEIALSPYDRDSFYLHGNSTPLGYTDYTFAVKA
ncbi:FMN-linked oxidoreductase [Schizophyllum commune H4-8]|uniref:NADH:flavin oxidoreductase/NADH oxidase N-terminal domain-containing protein n=1 Tax=Schizophyllum commune (strain H4-8 / FGSC 9210) TaxID=578458 RepID=D8PMX7_SCHCM|nr:FMN-linked oxidoreductase [Schizophyllum commune H4-8]KAI5893070.1 FMN-linked oxidoreductase [Schizophyllum commune H4-8]